MSRRYPKEFHEFMAQQIPGHTTKELVVMVKETFGIEMTYTAIKSYKTNHKIRSGTPAHKIAGQGTELFPLHICKFIAEQVEGVSNQELTALVNKTFGTDYTESQIKAYKKNHHLNSGLTGRFEKGHVSHNKGKKGQYSPGSEKGWFKKGHDPHNKTPIGTIHKRSDGCLYEKYGPGPLDWKPHHQLVWERANGPQPEGHVIIFKDGDRMNCSLDNLALITMAESLELTRRGLRSDHKEITETGILVARLNCEISKQKKKKGATNNGKSNQKGTGNRHRGRRNG